MALELKGFLDEEKTAIDDEDNVKEGQGEQQVVEETPLLHGDDSDEGQEVSDQSNESNCRDSDSRAPESEINEAER